MTHVQKESWLRFARKLRVRIIAEYESFDQIFDAQNAQDPHRMLGVDVTSEKRISLIRPDIRGGKRWSKPTREPCCDLCLAAVSEAVDQAESCFREATIRRIYDRNQVDLPPGE